MKVICIVGKHKSAKALLMETLIKELKLKGLRVGALKYHKHGDFEIDLEGKDTWRYAKAGADTVGIYSSVKFAMIIKVEDEMKIDELCKKFFMGSDVVLADGFTLSDKPRIIVADSEEEVETFKRGCKVLAVVGSEFEDVGALVERAVSFICSVSEP